MAITESENSRPQWFEGLREPVGATREWLTVFWRRGTHTFLPASLTHCRCAKLVSYDGILVLSGLGQLVAGYRGLVVGSKGYLSRCAYYVGRKGPV